jgi:hypothetical protein
MPLGDDTTFVDENDALSAMTMRALDLEGENEAASSSAQPTEGSAVVSPQQRAVEPLRPFLGGGGPWTAPIDGTNGGASLGAPPALPLSDFGAEGAALTSADAERASRSAAVAEDAVDAAIDEDALYALYVDAPVSDPESEWLMMEHAAKQAGAKQVVAPAAVGGARPREMTFMQRLAFELTDKRRVVPWDSASTDPVLLPLLFKLLTDRGLSLPELKLQLQAALGYDRTLNTRQLCLWLARHKQLFHLQKVRAPNSEPHVPLLLTVWRLSTWQAKHAEPQPQLAAAAAKPAAAAARPAAAAAKLAAAAAKPAAAAAKPAAAPSAAFQPSAAALQPSAAAFQPSATALPFTPAAHKLPAARSGLISSRSELLIKVAQLLGMNDAHGLTEPELLRALPHIGVQLRVDASAAGGLFGLCLQAAPATLALVGDGLQRRLRLRPPAAPAAPAAAKLSAESGKRLAKLAARGISIETEAELIAAVEAAMLAAPPPGLRLSILWGRVPPVPPGTPPPGRCAPSRSGRRLSLSLWLARARAHLRVPRSLAASSARCAWPPADLREMLGFEQPRGLSKWVKRHCEAKHWRLINEADGGGCLVPTGVPKGGGGAPLALGGKKAAAGAAPVASAAHSSIRELAAELGLSRFAAVLESNDVDVPALALLTQVRPAARAHAARVAPPCRQHGSLPTASRARAISSRPSRGAQRWTCSAWPFCWLARAQHPRTPASRPGPVALRTTSARWASTRLAHSASCSPPRRPSRRAAWPRATTRRSRRRRPRMARTARMGMHRRSRSASPPLATT